jgi:hypothetical protein
MSQPVPQTVAASAHAVASFAARRRTADVVFRGALAFNAALTAFWLFVLVTRRDTPFFTYQPITGVGIAQVTIGILFFYVLWGFLWYGLKNLLLARFVGFTREERRWAFSSRLAPGVDLADLLSRYSERRIRITDMVGRRGRFATIAAAGFFYLYGRVTAEHSPQFATLFLQDNLLDAVVSSWIFLALFRGNGLLAAAFHGAQARVMDGVLGRANCLLITTLWTAFKFVMVPLGAGLATVFPAAQFPAVFALIWGSYLAADGLAEIGGSLFGKQTLRVWGIGDINRKSIGGTVSGFVGSLALCLWIVHANELPAPWLGLALVIACSNTVLELCSPRGTDDFVMATTNALICLAFGMLMR